MLCEWLNLWFRIRHSLCEALAYDLSRHFQFVCLIIFFKRQRMAWIFVLGCLFSLLYASMCRLQWILNGGRLASLMMNKVVYDWKPGVTTKMNEWTNRCECKPTLASSRHRADQEPVAHLVEWVSGLTGVGINHPWPAPCREPTRGRCHT